MNQEKFNLNKARKEAEKHEKKSVSLVNELKIDKKEESQDFLEEELEAKYWRDLFEEKLDEIKDDEDFKNAAINKIENHIKSGKNGGGWNAVWVVRTISALKNLSLYTKEFKEKLNEFKDDEDFKKAAINLLENEIKGGKSGNSRAAVWALKTISALKNLSLYKEEFKEKLKEIKNDEDFKKAAINDLEDDIKKGKNGNSRNVNWALKTISALKNISEFWQDLAQEKMANMARDNKEGEDIPKRPELK